VVVTPLSVVDLPESYKNALTDVTGTFRVGFQPFHCPWKLSGRFSNQQHLTGGYPASETGKTTANTRLRHMRQRPYYSIRTGKNPNAAKLDLPMLLRLFHTAYKGFLQKDYFQEAFGYHCVDVGDVDGELGPDIEAYMFRILRKSNLWPIQDEFMEYSEDDLFDVIEFLYDCVSKPVDGWYHQYGGCGWHYHTFDQETGRREFRAEINDLLRDYKDGYELSEAGEILALAEHGLEPLLQAQLPEYDPENVETRVNAAILKFRRYRSSLDDRRDAVRALADVLEFLRPKLKKVLNRKDESALFEIANKFAIRHHDKRQMTNYDKPIWYSWMFYFYLATIHSSLMLIKKHEESGG